MSNLSAFVGWDPREDDAYVVCLGSLVDKSSIPLHIHALVDRHLSAMGLYTRTWHWDDGQRVDDGDGKPFSTDFAFTRFLVPALKNYSGWALFCDCDFLWRGDVADLLALADPKYAVMVVKHDHQPPETTKMDGAVQEHYRRKNWSSLVLWNCAHPSNAHLGRHMVNTSSGAFLHAFGWLADDEIGALPEEWNWLEGWSARELDPKAVHYTRGGPWLAKYRNVDYGRDWEAEKARIERHQVTGVA